MAENENKVQFNLKNVHYALLTVTDGKPTWAAPVRVPGAVNLKLSPQGEVSPFYADGIVYYQTIANNGYSGDLEMARFPEQMRMDIWGNEATGADYVEIENSNVEPKPYALLFQIDGDKNGEYFLLYNCSGTRPTITGATNTNTKTPQTETSTVSAVSLENGDVLARTTSKTPDSVKQNWFQQVYQRPEAGQAKE